LIVQNIPDTSIEFLRMLISHGLLRPAKAIPLNQVRTYLTGPARAARAGRRA
jgi:hypothetical protein